MVIRGPKETAFMRCNEPLAPSSSVKCWQEGVDFFFSVDKVGFEPTKNHQEQTLNGLILVGLRGWAVC